MYFELLKHFQQIFIHIIMIIVSGWEHKELSTDCYITRALLEVWGIKGEGPYFLGIWGEGSFTIREVGSKQNFWGLRDQEKHFREQGKKGSFI